MKKRNHQLIGFMKMLHKFHNRSLTMESYKSEKRINKKEKDIIDSWILLKACKFDEIFIKLKDESLENDLTEAQRLLILGIAYNNMANYKNAIHYVEKSIGLIELFNEENSHFTAYYNLFIAYFNSQETNGMEKSLAKLEEFPLNDTRNILISQCYFNFFSFQNNMPEAQKILNKMDQMQNQMTDSMHLTHLVSRFMFYVKLRKFDRCLKVLQDIKIKKGFHISANYKFMKLLLLNYTQDRPIYAYKEDFQSYPALYHQLMIIKHLESRQMMEARAFWNKLQIEFPKTYADNFKYLGSENIFSLCLEKYKPKHSNAPVSVDNLDRENALLKVLSNSPQGINKDELYYQVWGKALLDKTDLNRLQQYILKLRKNGIEISYKKSSYKLESIPVKKIS